MQFPSTSESPKCKISQGLCPLTTPEGSPRLQSQPLSHYTRWSLRSRLKQGRINHDGYGRRGRNKVFWPKYFQLVMIFVRIVRIYGIYGEKWVEKAESQDILARRFDSVRMMSGYLVKLFWNKCIFYFQGDFHIFVLKMMYICMLYEFFTKLFPRKMSGY